MSEEKKAGRPLKKLPELVVDVKTQIEQVIETKENILKEYDSRAFSIKLNSSGTFSLIEIPFDRNTLEVGKAKIVLTDNRYDVIDKFKMLSADLFEQER